ncbi:MAG: hypothetical protein WCP97_08205 [bacterium]
MKNKISLTLLCLCTMVFIPIQLFSYAPQKRLLVFLPFENYSAPQLETLTQFFTTQSITCDIVSSKTGIASAENSSTSITVPGTTLESNTKIVVGQTTIQDIKPADFSSNYDGIVIIGGRGDEPYFNDGFITATEKVSTDAVGASVSTLSLLVNQALREGKIIGGVEYGSALLSYIRLDKTADQTADHLGISILKGKNATTSPIDTITTTAFEQMGVILLQSITGGTPTANDPISAVEPVVVDGPTNFPDTIITGRDNSQETLTYFARTVLNALLTYPDPVQRQYSRRVAVFGGDEPTRNGNDVPYAKYTDIASNLALQTTLPLQTQPIGDEQQLLSALGTTDKSSPDYFDAIIYFRMYATGNQNLLNAALQNYVEHGGLLIILHHGLFNDGGKKGNLSTLTGLVGLAGGEIPSTLGSSQLAYPGPHYIINTNLGNFISTYNVVGSTRRAYTDTASTPNTIGNTNSSSSTYFSFTNNPDELITAITVNPQAQVVPLFGNNFYDGTASNRMLGWTRSVGLGKVVFYEPGERSDTSIKNENQQVLLNAILWGSQPSQSRLTPLPSTTPNASATIIPVTGTPTFRAKWISQTQGTGQGADKPHVLKENESVQIEAVFQNVGNMPWYNDAARQDYVGFYVYKDPLYSTPPEFNNPKSAFYGSSYFFDDSWGTSFDGKISHARAALLKEQAVLPGGQGHFLFNFHSQLSALPNSEYDNPLTPQNEYYYREDLTLAYGPNWMANLDNGDPFGRAHVWFPIRIVK